MKIIRDYGFRNMKHIQYDGTDLDNIKLRFTRISPNVLKRLFEWLKINNEVLDVDDCYDGASGWQGSDFKILGANLSYNGYCLDDKSIEMFLSGEIDKRWFSGDRAMNEFISKIKTYAGTEGK